MDDETRAKLAKLGPEHAGKPIVPAWSQEAALGRHILGFLKSAGIDVAQEESQLQEITERLGQEFTNHDDLWRVQDEFANLIYVDLFSVMDKIAPLGTSFRSAVDNEWDYRFWPKLFKAPPDGT